MKKKHILSLLFAIVLLIIIVSTAAVYILRPKQKIPVIGILNYTKAAERSLDGLKEGFSALGYTEGESIIIIYNGVITEETELEQEAADLISRPVDILITMSSKATLIAKKAAEGTGIPIIFGPVSNPVEYGIVKDLRHKGEDISGVMFGLQEDKRLEIMTEIDPDIRRIFVPYNFVDNSPANSIKKIEPARLALGLEFVKADIKDPSEIENILQGMPEDIDAVFIPTDPMLAANIGIIAEYATSRGLISSSPHREGVKEGALYSFSFDLEELGKEVARLTDQVLNGTSVQDIPVEVSEFFLSFNMSTAKRLNLQIPENLLRTAILYE